MSEFNSLYKKYNLISNLTGDLNNSIITLKRRQLTSESGVRERNPNLFVNDSEVAQALSIIERILSELSLFFENQKADNELYELKDNPVFQNQILDNIEFRDSILETLKKIKNKSKLEKIDWSNIDKLISILDNEAAILFRKLRSNRR